MSNWVEITVKGLDELKENLNKLSKEMQVKGGERAVRAGAAVILKAAKNKVPVKTGNLKKSLRIRRISNKGSTWPKFWVCHSTGRGVKNDGWYAHLVEFGGIKGSYPIRPRKRLYGGGKKALMIPIGSGGRSGSTIYGIYSAVRHPQSRAKPYMRPAFDENVNRSMDAIVKRMDKFIATGK